MRYLFLLFIGLLAAPLTAKADMIPEGMHVVENWVSIVNTDTSHQADYDKYNFYLTGTTHIGGSGSFLLTEQPQNLSISVEDLIAVKKTDVEKIKKGTRPDCPECGDSWFSLMENAQYISDVNLNFDTQFYLPDTDATVKISQVIGVSVSPKGISAEIISTTKEDERGVKTIVTPDEKTMMNSDNVVIGILVGLGILGLIFVMKTQKR